MRSHLNYHRTILHKTVRLCDFADFLPEYIYEYLEEKEADSFKLSLSFTYDPGDLDAGLAPTISLVDWDRMPVRQELFTDSINQAIDDYLYEMDPAEVYRHEILDSFGLAA